MPNVAEVEEVGAAGAASVEFGAEMLSLIRLQAGSIVAMAPVMKKKTENKNPAHPAS